MKSRIVSIYSKSTRGHRDAYLNYVSDILPCQQVGLARAWSRVGPVFFLMIEDSFALYVVTALLRSLWGRRTAGLLFRPGPAAEGTSLRLRAKRLILKMLKMLPTVRTLTIVPFSIASHFAEIADDGIYDLQLWDFGSDTASDLLAEHAAIAPAELTDAAGERGVVGAIGTQDVNKGYDVFASLWLANPDLRKHVLFASGGQVAAPLSEIARRFEAEGGFAVNRFISDDELLGFYASCNMIWCYYSPDYDQASGVLGRAIQFGVPVIVRAGSLSHKFCISEGVPHFGAEATTLCEQLAGPIPARDPQRGAKMALRFRQISLAKLESALGIRKSVS